MANSDPGPEGEDYLDKGLSWDKRLELARAAGAGRGRERPDAAGPQAETLGGKHGPAGTDPT
ncbi:hypothetical protein ACFSZS_18710 [Seohaeicola zhoushanensis]